MNKYRAAREGAKEIFFCRYFDIHYAGGCIPADIIPARVYRTVVPGVWRGCRWRGIDFMFCIVNANTCIECCFPGSMACTLVLQSNRAILYRNGNRIPQHARVFMKVLLGCDCVDRSMYCGCILHR